MPSILSGHRPSSPSGPIDLLEEDDAVDTVLERTRRKASRTAAAAFAAFGGACILAGVAGCLALGAPAPPGTPAAAIMCAAAAAACALSGTGLLLARRERSLRLWERAQTSRSERIQHELDMLGLTPKEMAVARLILQHRSYDEISKLTGLALRTVQFHASNAFRKAYVTRRRDFERLMLASADQEAETPADPSKVIVGKTIGALRTSVPKSR